MGIRRKIYGLLRLYRLDVFLRYIFFFLLGSAIAAGSGLDLTRNLLVALLVSGISFNFVYSLNSWFDAGIDAINKPWRPIPAGIVRRGEALAYALALLCLSLIYPFFLFDSGFAPWFVWFPVAGILYSNPVFSFKKNKYLSLLLIAATMLLVPVLGYFLNGGAVNAHFFLYLAVFIASTIAIEPLKDMSDIEGDKIGGTDNWFARGVRYERLAMPGLILAIPFLLSLGAENHLVRILTLFNLGYFIALSSAFFILRRPLSRFYRRLVVMFPLDLALLLAWYALLYAGILA